MTKRLTITDQDKINDEIRQLHRVNPRNLDEYRAQALRLHKVLTEKLGLTQPEMSESVPP